MRIVVASTLVPFADGVAPTLARGLVGALREHGHEAEGVDIPAGGRWHERPAELVAVRLLDLSYLAERVIALRSPSHLLRHPDKLVWALDPERSAYELWGTPYQEVPDTPAGREVRHAIVQADTRAMREARRVYAACRAAADRLRRLNGVEAAVLPPPLIGPERYRPGEFGAHLLYPTAIARLNRQALALEALRRTRSDVGLVLAGRPESPQALAEIEAAVARHGLAARVRILPGPLAEAERLDLLASALGCLHIPYGEPSYGYVTLESFQARKPVITCRDAGGVLELVEDGVNGAVAFPEPASLADAMDRLVAERERARAMGRAGYERLEALNLTWASVVEALTR